MLYRTTVLLNGLLALIAGAGAMSHGWRLYGAHFARVFELDRYLFWDGMSLVRMIGVGYVGLGLALLACVGLRSPAARLRVAAAMSVASGVGLVMTLAQETQIWRNPYGAVIVGLYLFFTIAYCLAVVRCFLDRERPALEEAAA